MNSLELIKVIFTESFKSNFMITVKQKKFTELKYPSQRNISFVTNNASSLESFIKISTR